MDEVISVGSDDSLNDFTCIDISDDDDDEDVVESSDDDSALEIVPS